MPVIEKVRGYAFFASYLINGDASGLTASEIKEADAFMAFCDGPVVSVEDDPHFAVPDNGGLPGTVVTYVVHVN